jgi:hypothetical protein
VRRNHYRFFSDTKFVHGNCLLQDSKVILCPYVSANCGPLLVPVENFGEMKLKDFRNRVKEKVL